jgi:hypothetical protein
MTFTAPLPEFWDMLSVKASRLPYNQLQNFSIYECGYRLLCKLFLSIIYTDERSIIELITKSKKRGSGCPIDFLLQIRILILLPLL